MKRRITTLSMAALLALVLLPLAACAKKAPTTTADARPPVTAAKPPATETNVAPPPKPAPPTDVEVTEVLAMDIEVLNKKGYLSDAFFDYDSYELRPDAQSAAVKAASYLVSHPDIRVVIGGYCDERGSAEYNLALGQNRAGALQKAWEGSRERFCCPLKKPARHHRFRAEDVPIFAFDSVHEGASVHRRAA